MNDAYLSEGNEFERHNVAVPIEFDGGRGTTLEMSARDVRFETAKRLIPGTLLELTLHFQTDGVRVTAQARVLRVQAGVNGSGLAEVTAEFEKVSFS